MKKLIVILLTVAMLLSMVACKSTETPAAAVTDSTETATAAEPAAEPAAEQGKVYNIYCWNDEFQTRFQKYFVDAGLVPDGITINWVITPNADNAYQNKLDETLLAQGTAAADDKIDLFLIEADYALKYVNSDYSLDVYSDLGLTEDDTAAMYGYTKDVCTDASGALKGLTWQACPAGLIYRRSIAKAVLGTDDPAEVQAKLDTWEKFEAVAADAKALGYYMVSGYDDDYRVFSNNATTTWVDENNKIQFDANILKWIEQTKTFTDNGYNNKAILWSPEQMAGAKAEGTVMCYFGPGWFFDFTLAPATLADSEAEAAVGNGSYGDWAIVKGPQGYYWGGTWLCAAAGSDNLELTTLIMKTMTCDKDTLVGIVNDFNDFTNNEEAMTEIANSDFSSAFLGGQNYISVLLDSAKSIKFIASPYDQGCNEKLLEAMRGYFNGTATYDEAMENFYTLVLEKYPELSR
ncbi:MAG: carbohydrate ABC transporter substrate-binding protein [Clostridiaceae bacterium]